MKIRKKYCRKCKARTTHYVQPTSHLLHLILSVLTGGLWVPVWIIITFTNSTQTACAKCHGS